MFLRDKVIMVSGWCYLLTVLTSILMLTSCVPTTFDNTGLVVPPDQEYADIQKTATTLSTTDELATADILIGKSESFISMYPKYKHVDEVYYILGITLVQYDRTEEGIAVLDELIRYYPLAPSVEKSMFTLGLAYDKINKHDKADAVYGKLVNSPKFGNGKYAMNAQKLLTTDKADRKGALEGLANLEDGSKPTNFRWSKSLRLSGNGSERSIVIVSAISRKGCASGFLGDLVWSLYCRDAKRETDLCKVQKSEL